MKNMLEPLVENAASLYRDMHTERKAPSQADTTRWTDAVRRGRIFFYGTREVEIGLCLWGHISIIYNCFWHCSYTVLNVASLSSLFPVYLTCAKTAL